MARVVVLGWRDRRPHSCAPPHPDAQALRRGRGGHSELQLELDTVQHLGWGRPMKHRPGDLQAPHRSTGARTSSSIRRRPSPSTQRATVPIRAVRRPHLHRSGPCRGARALTYDYLINATGPKLNFGATPGLGPDGFSCRCAPPGTRGRGASGAPGIDRPDEARANARRSSSGSATGPAPVRAQPSSTRSTSSTNCA